MYLYIRVVLDEGAASDSASEKEKLRDCVASAPGVASVNKIEPHVRGGYRVIVDRDGPVDDVLAHLETAGYIPVI